jgi:hypothetical protein
MPDNPSSPRRGRPKKFAKPSRAVAVTLPTDVISALHAIDADLSQAIVRLVETSVPGALHAAAEVARFGRRAVITVPPTQELESQTGAELVPLADGRALVAFNEQMSIADLELRIGDVLAESAVQGEERATFEAFAEILRRARRSDTVEVKARRIIVFEYRS